MNGIDLLALSNERAWELVEEWARDQRTFTRAQAAELLAGALTVNYCTRHPGAPLIGGRCGLCPVVPDVCVQCQKEITGRWIGPLTGPGLGGPKYHAEIPGCRAVGENHSQQVWNTIVTQREEGKNS